MTTGSAAAHVLVVEDDPDTRALLTGVLRDAGWHVVAAADGETALELAAQRPPDVVVLDLILPGATGWEVANRLGKQVGRPVPIIVATGARADLFRLPPHVACVIPKPFDPETVVRAVHSVLRGSSVSTTAGHQRNHQRAA